jgi:hypothetical protein
VLLTTHMYTPRLVASMARYSAFLGRRVEVHYRAGDIILPASGTFVADSGKSIFLEQHLTQHGQQKNFRWEIPYQYIVHLQENKEPPAADGKSKTPVPQGSSRAKSLAWREDAAKARSTSAASAATPGDTAAILPVGHPPKTA